MKKIFTLVLMAFVVCMNLSAERKVVYSGSFALGYDDATTVKIPASSFTGISVGDKVTMVVNDNIWCKMISGDKFSEKNASNLKYQIEVDAAWQTEILANGINIQGSPTLFKVYFGNDIATPKVLYTNDEGYQIIAGWGNSFDEFTKYDFSNATVGDVLTFTVECTAASGDWHPLVIRSKADGNYKQYNTSGQTTITVTIDQDLLSFLNNSDITGDQFKLKGISYTHETETYVLNAKSDFIDLSTINGKTVNIDLCRKYDWNTTICVPFDIADVATTFGLSAKAYTLNKVDGEENLVFDETNNIEAGKPYLMTFNMTGVEGDKSKTISFEDVTINTTLTNASASGVSFKGNYTTGFGMSGKYGVACKQHDENWDWGFYKGGSSSTLPAFSAYIESNVTPSRGFSISTGDGTTNIESSISEEEDNGDVYNLMGMKTNASHKGIYIKNGKKYITK